MNKIIPIFTAILAGVIVFSVITFQESQKETRRELETKIKIREAINQLRGDIDPKVTNEQLSWYNAGIISLLTSMSREFKGTGEIRFAPIIIDADDTVERDDNGNIKRANARVLIQKVNEFKLVE